MRVDTGVLQDDGQLKCWYVANAGDDRGNLTCSYYVCPDEQYDSHLNSIV